MVSILRSKVGSNYLPTRGKGLWEPFVTGTELRDFNAFSRKQKLSSRSVCEGTGQRRPTSPALTCLKGRPTKAHIMT